MTSLTSKFVRTRIAPSPTGNLHIGTVRTALYNLLFARKHGGHFYFRLEDTDMERSKEEFTQEIIDGFRFLGIEWDRPDFKDFADVVFEDGIVRQSTRNSAHRAYIEQLISSKRAYKCYTTPDEMEKLRESQRAQKLPEGYDNRGRNYTENQIKEFQAENRPYVIRLNLGSERDIKWTDLVRGEMSINTRDLGGDPVIMKANGQVLYNFAVVADDADMGITHVFRGEDHLTNTAKQITIYEAFGFPVPEFGHLPLIFTKDRQKLSKRKHGDIAGVEKYIKEGYLPSALNNYLVATSYSCPSGQEIFDLAHGASFFDISCVSKSPAVYDIDKLNWYNREYMSRIPYPELLGELKKYTKFDLDKFSTADLQELIEAIRGNLNKFIDIDDNIDYFYSLPELGGDLVSLIGEAKDLLSELAKRIEAGDFDFSSAEQMKSQINKLGEDLNLKGKRLFMPIRAVLSARQHGPDLGLIMKLLGKETVLARMADFG